MIKRTAAGLYQIANDEMTWERMMACAFREAWHDERWIPWIDCTEELIERGFFVVRLPGDKDSWECYGRRR